MNATSFSCWVYFGKGGCTICLGLFDLLKESREGDQTRLHARAGILCISIYQTSRSSLG